MPESVMGGQQVREERQMAGLIPPAAHRGRQFHLLLRHSQHPGRQKVHHACGADRNMSLGGDGCRGRTEDSRRPTGSSEGRVGTGVELELRDKKCLRWDPAGGP